MKKLIVLSILLIYSSAFAAWELSDPGEDSVCGVWDDSETADEVKCYNEATFKAFFNMEAGTDYMEVVANFSNNSGDLQAADGAQIDDASGDPVVQINDGQELELVGTLSGISSVDLAAVDDYLVNGTQLGQTEETLIGKTISASVNTLSNLPWSYSDSITDPVDDG